MKKRVIRSLCALIALAIALVAAPYSNAAAPCSFSLSSASVHAHARTVPLTLSLKSEAQIALAQFTIDLPDGFSLVSASTAFDDSPVVTADSNGDITVYYSNAEAPLTGDLQLATVLILLPEELKTGDNFALEIKIEEGDVTDAAGKAIETSSTAGKINVDRDIIYGDVNCDCAINARDVTLLMKRLANATITQFFDLVASDVNRDTDVNAKDVIMLMKYLAGTSSIRLEHVDVKEVLEPATCQKTGLVRLTCTICGDSVVVTLPLADHDYEGGVCKNCGAKHPDYPVIVYTDFLRRNGELQDNLRGFALYKSEQKAQYKLFESNICDSKSGSLVLYGVATFDNGLMCYVSIELAGLAEKYTLHYDAFYKSKSIGSAVGALSGNTATFDETTDIEAAKVQSHLKIAQAIASDLIAYTDSLLKASALGMTLEDFGLAAK